VFNGHQQDDTQPTQDAQLTQGVELTSDVIICAGCKRSFVDARHLVAHKQTGACQRPPTAACICRRHGNAVNSSHVTGEQNWRERWYVPSFKHLLLCMCVAYCRMNNNFYRDLQAIALFALFFDECKGFS